MLGYDVLWLLIHFGAWGSSKEGVRYEYWMSLRFVHILGLSTVFLEIVAKIGLAYILNK